MTHYDDDFIKSIQGFDEILNDDWYERLTKISDDAKLPMELKWFVNELRIAIKALFVVVNSEMGSVNLLAHRYRSFSCKLSAHLNLNTNIFILIVLVIRA